MRSRCALAILAILANLFIRIPLFAQVTSDINTIGTRDVNAGTKPFVPTFEQEIAIGRQLSAEFEQQTKLFKDPAVTEYVSRIGQTIVRNSDAKIPFSFKVVDSAEINSVSLPGGFVYINTGLIATADSEGELAAALAHQVAHVTARHAVEQHGRASLFDTVTSSMFLNAVTAKVAQDARSAGLPLNALAYSRADETEADWLGLQYLYKSGYSPESMLLLFEKLRTPQNSNRKVSSLFSTHPQTEDRIKTVREKIDRFLPPRQYLPSTAEFETVKARLPK